MKNGLLSYPRSGNHLTRFMIELLTETPTYGCQTNALDIPIYQNHFKCEIPFNITNTNTSTKTKAIIIMVVVSIYKYILYNIHIFNFYVYISKIEKIKLYQTI